MKKMFKILMVLISLSSCATYSNNENTMITDRKYLPDKFVFSAIGEISYAKIENNITVIASDYFEFDEKEIELLKSLFRTLELVDSAPRQIDIQYLYELRFSLVNNGNLFFISRDLSDGNIFISTFDNLSSNLENSQNFYTCDNSIVALILENLK